MSDLENIHTPEQPFENTYRAQILQEAESLINGQRQLDYGPPEENFKRIADHWTIHLKRILVPGAEITPRLVAEMMLLLKVARTVGSPTKDSYVDGAGYAAIAAELAKNEQKDI